MIIVKVMAGLGNQMFQYATGRRLAHVNKTELKLDVTGYNNMAKQDTPRQYELDVFNISGKIATPNDLARVKPAEYQRSIPDKVGHWLGRSSAMYQYGERHAGFNAKVLRLRDNTYLVGWWQSEKYFADIKDIIQKEFVPRQTASGQNAKWLDQARASNSVSVHVRRGDYVSNKHANVHHGLASADYYNQAGSHIKKQLAAPHFFVFSDDIDWCKQNLRLGNNATFIEGNGGARAYEDLRIMSACKHNVLANSSFSWWGAWLNPNPDKIVIAPKMWFQDKKANAETDIVPDTWIRL